MKKLKQNYSISCLQTLNLKKGGTSPPIFFENAPLDIFNSFQKELYVANQKLWVRSVPELISIGSSGFW